MILGLLILFCACLNYYSHWVLRTEVVFSHFFYIPIALAGFWWGRRGIWTAILLGVLLVVSHLLSGVGTPILSDAFRAVGFMTVGLTVGLLREQTLNSERNLRETRDYLDSLIRYANAPIIVWDKEGKFTLVNAAFEKLTGYSADEMIGRSLSTVFSGTAEEESLQKIEQTLKGRRWEGVEIPTCRKDGEERIILWNSANIYAPDGKSLIATIAQGQDITLRKKAEESLHLQMKGLEDHERDIESMLEQRVRELGAFESIINAMLSTFDLEERLQIGLSEIMNLTGVEKAGVSLIEGDRLVMRRQFGFSETFLAWAGDLAVEEVPSCEEVTEGWNDIPDPSSLLEAAFKKERVKSWVTVPFRSEQGFLGILILASVRQKAFSRQQIGILSALSNSLTLMLEQSNLYRTAQERQARLTTLREIDIAISSNLSLEGIIEVVLRKVSPHIWVDAVGISLIDWERKRIILARLHLPGDINIDGEAFGMSDSLLAQLGVEKNPVVIYDVKTDPRLQNHRDIARKYSLCSYVGVPLLVQNEAIGVLHLFTVKPYQFRQEDLDFFCTLAGQAAISVQNARLFEQAKRRASNMENLARAKFDFTRVGHEKELAKIILISACDITGAGIGGLFWFSEDTNILEPAGWIDVTNIETDGEGEIHLSSPLEPGTRLPEQVAYARKAIYVPDVSREPLWEMKSMKTGSVYIVPLVHGEHVFGIYTFLSREIDAFSSEQRALADTFAGYTSAALDNARLFKEIKKAHEDLQSTQKQLLHVQKMEAIGTLSAGIAHDFNNLLVPILGFTEIVRSDLPEESEAREDLSQVLKAGERAKALVDQILSFGRQTEGIRRPVYLSSIIKEVLRLLRATLPTTIKIRQKIAPNMNPVNADPAQIHQVLINLCMNAEQAMPEGGELEISLAGIKLNKKQCSRFDGLTPGSYVRLTVKDTGCGMDERILERIFDPFYTTREQEVGTGLGLSVVRGIVKSHGGDITVNSRPDTGTTFQVYLPAAELPDEIQPETPEPVQGGTESILFVDDELLVVKMGKKTLERLGYRVTTRTSSVKALKLFRLKPDEFDLIITDLTMQQMTGDKLAVQLLGIQPDIPVILCTGYSSVITPDKANELGIRELVMKPIVGDDLCRIVRRVLDESSKKEDEGVE